MKTPLVDQKLWRLSLEEDRQVRGRGEDNPAGGRRLKPGGWWRRVGKKVAKRKT